MLKRISSIKNIGAFRECNGRQYQFNKITLIYGRNTYGKSTLGDIFSSLQTSVTNSLIARKTIPYDNSSSQNIELSFAGEQGGTEVKSIYKNGTWIQSLPNTYKLSVYDDGFYHRNVFLGRNLTRDTKDSFNDFILGAKGVEKALVIKEKNRLLNASRLQKNKIETLVFSKVEKLYEFIELPLIDDIEIANLELDTARQEYAVLLKQKKQSEGIRARKNLTKIVNDLSFNTAVSDINKVLEFELNNQHEQAKLILAEHIEKNFHRPEGAEQWVQQGLNSLKGDNCNFCGQTLTPEANQLLDFYRQCFDDQFSKHELHVNKVIKAHQGALNTHWIETLMAQIKNSSLIIETYPELPIEDDLITAGILLDIRMVHDEITKLLFELVNIVEQTSIEVKELIVKKLQDPDKKISSIAVINLSELTEKLTNNLSDLADLYFEFNKATDSFKVGFEDAEIDKKLEKLLEKGKEKSRLVDRYNLNDSCVEYQSLTNEVNTLSQEVPKLKTALENEQFDYLSKYFDNINGYFKELGSKDFILECKPERRGYKPLYSFIVKFKNTIVAESNFDKVFSESDRRALSLAIFLASLDGLEEDELAKTIVVLDDPVTSFDENRVGETHRILVRLSESCQQVILLSHFKDAVASFLKTHGFSRDDITLIEIYKDHIGSNFRDGNIDAFIKSAHQLNTDKLLDFVDRRIENLNCSPRVYLEEALQLRFAKQIAEQQVTNESLSKRIDSLQEYLIISETIASRLHEWRKELNPEHHVWLGEEIEDKRNKIANLLNFIFYELNPEPVT
jgi:wobble nucleotide-excising tRNase